MFLSDALKVCTLALFTIATAHATAHAAAQHGPLVGRPAPGTPLKAIDGRDMSVATARGRYLLLVFSDVKSRLGVRAFLAQNAARFSSVRWMSVYNIMVPGPILIPRAAWLRQARSDASRAVAEARATVMTHQQAGFDEVDFRFHADFDRRFSDLFRAPGAVVSLVLIDSNGYIAVQEEDADEPAMRRIMQCMREGRLAPGSKPPVVRTPESAATAGTTARHQTASRLGVQARPRRPGTDGAAEEAARSTSEDPPAPGRDGEAAVTAAPAPPGASKKKSRLHYRY